MSAEQSLNSPGPRKRPWPISSCISTKTACQPRNKTISRPNLHAQKLANFPVPFICHRHHFPHRTVINLHGHHYADVPKKWWPIVHAGIHCNVSWRTAPYPAACWPPATSSSKPTRSIEAANQSINHWLVPSTGHGWAKWPAPAPPWESTVTSSIGSSTECFRVAIFALWRKKFF